MEISADQAVETFQMASEENQIDALRDQQVINLPADAELMIAGDIHDHRRNFDKLVRTADLANNPQRHLILQELIHGDHYDASGAEESWMTLHRAAELKCDYSGQVHFLLANHDLAQIHGEGIMKAGLSVCEAFTKGVKNAFGTKNAMVNVAITEFLLSLPLAIRCPNGIFCCHSLPTDAQVDKFDYTVFNRPLTGPDYQRKNGPVYQLIWGRNMSPAAAAAFAEKVGASILVTGHQPQDAGYLVNGDRHLILASEHNQGVFLQADLSETYDMKGLVRRLRKFVTIE
jgi:hypothetical protein